MNTTVSLAIDEDGFFALVSPDRYRGFIAEDWELDQLISHFASAMNIGSLFIAYPGPDDADQPVAFGTDRPAEASLREVASTMKVNAAGLWLTDYTQLTMAARYQDEAPTASSATRIPVSEGLYTVVFQQMGGNSGYLLTITPAAQSHSEMLDLPGQHLDTVPSFS